MPKKRKFSISLKIYLFVTLTVFIVAFGTAVISFSINVNQIDNYFKNLTYNSAENFAALVDGDFFSRLKKIAESEEYQKVRERAVEEENDKPIEDYLKEKGIWEEYKSTQDLLCRYLRNMHDIKYLYVVELNGRNAEYDMYIMDDDENPLTQTGYYEEREPELAELDTYNRSEPKISNGDWGWLCSAFAPVYDAKGKVVCHVGCDVSMDDVMKERSRFFMYIVIGALLLTVVVLAAAILFANKVLIDPLNRLTSETKKFKPQKNTTYDNAHVLNLDLKSNDEIYEIHNAIRSMQINIIDYLNDLSKMEKDKEQYVTNLKKAESDIKTKEEQIGQISKEIYRDALTSVGSKTAYIKATEKLNEDITTGNAEFALVMVDLNDLKKINDEYGHKSGDLYIQGCCHIICDVYKHSPVFRIGGDEFVIILKGEDYANRLELLEQSKAEFNKALLQESTDPWGRYSAAIGMAEYSSDDSTVELVFKRADKAMYNEKLEYKKANGSYR